MAAGTTTYRAGCPAAEVAAALATGGFELGGARPVTVVVLDSFDGRLTEAGLRLTATTPRGGGPATIALGPPAGVAVTVTLAEPPRAPSDLPAGPLRARMAELLDVRVLLPLVALAATRREAVHRNRDGKVTAMAALIDEVRRPGGDVVDGPFVEVTELVGYAGPAGRTRRVVEEVATALDADLAAFVAAVNGVDLGGVRVEPGIPLDPTSSAIDGYRAVLANLREAIVANRDGTIADLDPEFLHDLRVAVRRTRAILAHAKGAIAPAVLEPVRADFKWLGRITSPPRDLDVYQIEWPTYVAGLDAHAAVALEPIRLHLAAERATAHSVLADQLDGEAATRIIDAWGAWLAQPTGPDALAKRSTRPLGHVVGRRIRKAHRTMIDDGRGISSSSPATDLHELRKDAKKLRYLLECFGGLYEPAARKRFVGRLKALQDNLGEHQDADVHVHQLAELAERLASQLPPATILAAGRLIERMEQRRTAARREFAARFAKFDSDETRDALSALLDGGS